MYLVVGLGNPGARYRKTRHNIGFMLVDLLAERAGSKFSEFGAASLTCRIALAETDILLAKPQTYMNQSGRAVRELISKVGTDLKNVLVVYDEVALSFGRLRFRKSGSSGGHNGMQSIIDYLGSTEIPRLRIGIGGDASIEDLSNYVLGKFRFSERRQLKEVLELAADGVQVFITEGVDRAMAQFN